MANGQDQQLTDEFSMLQSEDEAFGFTPPEAPQPPAALLPFLNRPTQAPVSQPVFGTAIDDPALAAAQRRSTGVPGGLATLLSGIGGAIGGGVGGAQQAIKGTRESLQQPIQNILQQRQAVLQTQRAQRQKDLNDPNSQTSKFLQNQFIKQTEDLAGRKLSEEELNIAKNLRATDASLVQNALQTELGISSLASTINERRLKGLQDAAERQDKLTVQQEKDRRDLAKLSIPGRGMVLAATKGEAKELREKVATVEKSTNSIIRLEELVKEFGDNPLKKISNRDAIAVVEAIRIPLRGALRLELVGPGAVTDFEQKILNSVLRDPSALFTIASANLRSFDELKNTLNSGLNSQLNARGLVPFEEGQEVFLGIKKAESPRKTVRVQRPDGQIGIIPTENLDKALKAGFKRVE